MRVITGTARGKRLGQLSGTDTRPTTDRVKEGIFNIIQFDIEGRRVLDLFAGTGQMGIECLSPGRGALHLRRPPARGGAAQPGQSPPDRTGGPGQRAPGGGTGVSEPDAPDLPSDLFGPAVPDGFIGKCIKNRRCN